MIKFLNWYRVQSSKAFLDLGFIWVTKYFYILGLEDLGLFLGVSVQSTFSISDGGDRRFDFRKLLYLSLFFSDSFSLAFVELVDDQLTYFKCQEVHFISKLCKDRGRRVSLSNGIHAGVDLPLFPF